MDNVNKEIVEFFKTVGFSLIEIKSSVFRIEESTLVFQTDHKDHTIDASTILYKDAEKILTQALQAQRDAGAGESLNSILESGLLEEKPLIKSIAYTKENAEATVHNTLARAVKAHLDELIKSIK